MKPQEQTPIPSVLVVEDEAVIALDIRRQLEGAGVQVVGIVATGHDVGAAVERWRPGLVLMDVRLRGEIDGITMAEDLYTCDDIPVVFLSAYTDPEMLSRASRAGAYAYIVKPFSSSTLLATLRMVHSKHSEVRRVREELEWLRELVAGLEGAIVAVDDEGTLVLTNRAAEQLLGESRLGLNRQRPAWLETLRAATGPVSFALAAPGRTIVATPATSRNRSGVRAFQLAAPPA